MGILPQIMNMAAALKLDVIVEGVETEEQAAYFVPVLPPVLVQGWSFGRPMEAEAFLRRLAEDEKNALVAATAV